MYIHIYVYTYNTYRHTHTHVCDIYIYTRMYIGEMINWNILELFVTINVMPNNFFLFSGHFRAVGLDWGPRALTRGYGVRIG